MCCAILIAGRLHATGDPEGGIRLYERALAFNPRYPDALYNLGVACGEAGLSDRAVFAYEMAAQLNPSCAEVHEHILGSEALPGHLQQCSNVQAGTAMECGGGAGRTASASSSWPQCCYAAHGSGHGCWLMSKAFPAQSPCCYCLTGWHGIAGAQQPGRAAPGAWQPGARCPVLHGCAADPPQLPTGAGGSSSWTGLLLRMQS